MTMPVIDGDCAAAALVTTSARMTARTKTPVMEAQSGTCRCTSRMRSGLCVIAQELDQQRAHQVRLLLLHPVTGAIEKMESDHTRARARPHLVDCTRRLIDTPIAFPR